MLDRYRDVKMCKADIKHFTELVQIDVAGVSDDKIRHAAKGIIFIKRVFLHDSVVYKHYSECLLSDSLNLIYSLGKKSLRLYYAIYRSIIENFVRVILKYENYNDTGVRNMFSELRTKYENSEKIFIDYLEGEYGKCCDIIHCNIKADLCLHSYYEEFISGDEMNDTKINFCIDAFCTFCDKIKKFTIKNIPILINDCFYNHKELLSYLVGEKYFSEFEKKNN